MKKVKYVLLLLLMFVPSVLLAETGNEVTEEMEDTNKIPVYIFHSETCPVCIRALAFFESLETTEYNDYFELVDYEVSTYENYELMEMVSDYFDDDVNGSVPYIVIGDTRFPGYTESWDEEIKAAIKEEYESENRYDAVGIVTGKVEAPKKESNDILILGVIVVVVAAVAGLIWFARAKSN